MKCDLLVAAYDNYSSREAVTHLGDHGDICCLVHSTLELLKRWKELHYQEVKVVLYKTRLQAITLF